MAHSFELLSISDGEPGCSRAGATRHLSHHGVTGGQSSPESDSDVEEDTDDDSSDAEYIPSVPIQARKRRYSPYSIDRSKRRPSGAVPSSPSSSSSSPIRTGGRARPRNAQSNVLPDEFEQALRNRACTCPTCGFVPASKRAPDLRRHMNTHRADVTHQTWVCCGVPVEEAGEYGIGDTSKQYVHKGRDMVGGCMQSFSRKDALMRHLKNDKIDCRGSVKFAEQLGEV